MYMFYTILYSEHMQCRPIDYQRCELLVWCDPRECFNDLQLDQWENDSRLKLDTSDSRHDNSNNLSEFIFCFQFIWIFFFSVSISVCPKVIGLKIFFKIPYFIKYLICWLDLFYWILGILGHTWTLFGQVVNLLIIFFIRLQILIHCLSYYKNQILQAAGGGI